MGHATACAAALAVQRTIREEGLLQNVRVQGRNLDRALHDRFGNHPCVGDIRGRGLFRSIELVEDRGSKKPFDPGLKMHARVKRAAMEHGLCCYPMGGCVDGREGDHVMLAPPFIVSENEIEEIVDRLSEAVDSVIHGVA
jgi:adenosylmethionine-8-amino-7-oxononanoate aminotransferase